MAPIENNFFSWMEYLNNKKKLVTTPKKEEVPDYDGPTPTKPDKPATSGDHWSTGVKPKGTPAPYKGPGTDPGQKKGEKGGFGDMGDKELKYEPKAGIVDKAGEGGDKKKSWPNVATVKLPGQKKVEAFLNHTKDMSLAEFAKYIKEQQQCEGEMPNVIAYAAGPFHPDPIQAIRYVTFLAAENQQIMSALLQEAKRIGCIDKMVDQLLDIPETYTEIVNKMSVDPSVSNQIARAMNDQYQETKDGSFPKLSKEDEENLDRQDKEQRKVFVDKNKEAFKKKLKNIGEACAPPAHKDETLDDETDDHAPDEESEPDNIEGEEGGSEDTDDPAFDTDTGSGGVTPNESPNKLAHQNLSDAIKKYKDIMRSY